MDRVIIYPGAIPLETDLLQAQKDALVGLAKLSEIVLGTGQTLLSGLACTPTAPASMQVQVAPGQIYAPANIDDTAYSSIAADVLHSVLKQGVSLDTVTLNCPAPATAGFSINYLVQVGYLDSDSDTVVLPYYNASNPAVAYTGPNNTGVAQNTRRKGVCSVLVKAGIAAATGTQTTPAPDAGYVGAYVVTVANGQATITAGDITLAVNAPFILHNIMQLAPLASPALTGVPTAPTPAAGTNSVQVATAAFVQAAIAAFVPAVNVLAYAATITPDLALGENFKATLTGNCTLANMANPTPGQSGFIEIIQDATGGRTMAYGSYWKFEGGDIPSLTAAANAIDILVYVVESATRITAKLIADTK